MNPGVLALGGIFGIAVILIVLQVRHRSAIGKRLLRQGFTPCDEEAQYLQRSFTELAGGHGATTPRGYRVARCYKKAGGWGMVYRFTVADLTFADADRNSVGGRLDVYLIDLREPDTVSSGPVSVFVVPKGPRVFLAMMEKLIALRPYGAPLEIPKSPHTGSFVAAFGAVPGKLDELLPGAIQERLSRAAEHGFFSVHIGGGKVALAGGPDQKDVDRLWNYAAEWL